MDRTYWHKQSASSPLFPDLQWSRPEYRALAGKLAIIGGNAQGFSAPAEAYIQAQKAGIGTINILLPAPLRKITKLLAESIVYAPANPSGSFSRQALAEWLDIANQSDATLLAGDLGRNSETAIVFESFMTKYQGRVIITGDAVAYALNASPAVINRPNTTLVLTAAQLQKYAILAGSPSAITQSGNLVQVIDVIHNLTMLHAPNLITNYDEHLCVAVHGQVSTTDSPNDDSWHRAVAAAAATWWLQNPDKPFEALSTAVVSI